MDKDYPRDMVGYGANPPDADWPGGARLALQIVMNYEEGGENSILHGDPASENAPSDYGVLEPRVGVRHLTMESFFEYGSRVGFWRLLRLFEERNIPITVFAVGMALERNPEAAAAMVAGGHEVADHGWRWIDHQHVDERTEREYLQRSIAAITRLTGSRPLGFYMGRTSPNTRRLVVEEGGFLYDSDSYADDLPYWTKVGEKPHLVVPYTFDNNDARFWTPPGFSTGDDFFTHMRDSFDVLYAESAYWPRMMSVGLHMRNIGRPGRIAALARFLDHVAKSDGVWICRRVDIARHWIERHPMKI